MLNNSAFNYKKIQSNIKMFAFFQHYYSLQCHTILQKSFQYADLVLKKHFLLSMLKTIVNIFYIFSIIESSKEQYSCEIEMFWSV